MDTAHAQSVATTVFVTLGAILLLLVVAVMYFILADPLNVKPLLFGTSSGVDSQQTAGVGAVAVAETTQDSTAPQAQATASAEVTARDSFTLSEAQKSALRGLGVDPASIPSTISPVQVACFEEALGTARVSEIRAGAVPSAFELLKVKSCIN